MGQMFAWATPDFLLDYMTLEEVIFYYNQGLEFEEMRASLIISKLAEALDDKKKQKKPPRLNREAPDKAAFYKHYGDKIERPGKGGES